ncbi:unnamed protein product, partial [Mesorhabditis belari]|uniref:Haloacid dehalogenase-like hydrolase domain-containing 5 n=1 Tax=Mesorhabditis belari TaxID=2138241 RepID=A0AAF3FNG5_9BILA
MSCRGITKFLRVPRLLSLPTCSSSTTAAFDVNTPFGIVLDIDGVLLRGRDVLPRVPDAFRLITDEKGNFKIPTVFLTNGSNSLRAAKANSLSQHLKVEIRAQQVVMAHSPLRMFTQFHDKKVLVVGQGPVNTIAQNLGFKQIITLDDLRTLFPHLDCVDFSRRKFDELNWHPPEDFRPIEAIVLLGEPLHWESALQLLLDVLITGGDPASLQYKRGSIQYPNLPLLACNVDMVWMAEKGVNLPRIGHGSFLTCLEAMYGKLTGRDLRYTAVLGKPTEVSYLHATHCLQDMANDLQQPPPKAVYVIGDNPLSDILGSNLYNRYLQHGGKGRFDHYNLDTLEDDGPASQRTRENVDECISVLVETGVYREGCKINGTVMPISKLVQELSVKEREMLEKPDFVEKDLYSAIRMIINREQWRD